MSMKLKKQVKQLLADDTTQGTDISGLKTTVGDSSKGLVKDTADLKTAVGADDTAGLKTNIHVNRAHAVDFFFVKNFFIIAGIRIAQEIPAGIHKGIHSIWITFSICATLGAFCMHKFGTTFQW